jgi:AhpD family alkylhydroperoxidase
MRLTVLHHGHRLRARLFFALTERLSRVEAVDLPKMLLYRPEFFGRTMLALSAPVMRGPSFFSAGEREFMAMRTAQWQRCPFCIEAHTELVRIASAGAMDPADADSIRPQLAAVLRLLETVSCTPDLAAAEDVERVRAAGVPEPAIADALRVNLIFNVISRLANAFGFTLRDGQLHSGTRALHRFGYRFPGFLTRGRPRLQPAGLVDELRRCAVEPPASARAYAALVRDASYRVTDADVARLKDAGHSEDEIFEITVAAAVAAGLRSLDAGSAAQAASRGPSTV